jgi:hypothetical protein
VAASPVRFYGLEGLVKPHIVLGLQWSGGGRDRRRGVSDEHRLERHSIFGKTVLVQQVLFQVQFLRRKCVDDPTTPAAALFVHFFAAPRSSRGFAQTVHLNTNAADTSAKAEPLSVRRAQPSHTTHLCSSCRRHVYTTETFPTQSKMGGKTVTSSFSRRTRGRPQPPPRPSPPAHAVHPSRQERAPEARGTLRGGSAGRHRVPGPHPLAQKKGRPGRAQHARTAGPTARESSSRGPTSTAAEQ